MSATPSDPTLSRRRFLHATGVVAAAATLNPSPAFAGEPASGRKLRMGVVGGRFGANFYFSDHPNAEVVAVSDLFPERREKLMRTYRCFRAYESLEILLRDPKVEAVGIFTGAPDHVRHSVAALRAGKHVLSAVPAAMTLEECQELVDTVKSTGLTYMMAETSYYRQPMISARKFHAERRFGTIFASEAEYHHPGLETYFFEGSQPTWRHGLPPMKYPTHCTAFLVGLTGERLVEVTCHGWGDDSPLLKGNRYDNPFWNETAFFKTDRGHSFRVAVSWKGALMNTERAQWFGDKMSFYMEHPHGDGPLLVHHKEKQARDDAGFKFKHADLEKYEQPKWWETELLPPTLRKDSGHGGSHTFITHEFIDAIVSGRRPAIDVFAAVAYTAPGIVAHESALRGGELLKIPNFGP